MTGDRLYVTDLDGTLLGTDSLVSPESARIISALTRRGAMITVATARTPATVEPLLSHTLTTPPAVVLTGAAIWDRSLMKYRSIVALAPDLAQMVTETAISNGLHPLVYKRAADNRHLAFYYNPAMLPADEMKFVTDRDNLELKKAIATSDILTEASRPDNVLVLALGSPDAVEATVASLSGYPELSVSSYSDTGYPGVGFLEVFGSGVSKAAGIETLRRITGARHVTVFGDNLNDLPMMAAADRSVAVNNALDEVKNAVDEVIGPNSTDSVAHYIATDLGVKISSLL